MTAGIRKRPAPADDEARFVEIYRRYGKPIQAYCARRTDRSQVADAVAETFLVAWRRFEQLPEGDAALPWLYGVAYRVLSHQWRHRTRSRSLVERLSGLTGIETVPPDVVVVRSEEYRMVLTALARLRTIDQEILRLTVWEELSYPDVALVLQIEEGAVRQRVYRARRNLGSEYRKLTGDHQPPAARKGGGS
ncbi:MAG TPA: sigma-70 family RNA polymerase sigma factor [Acidimicrobiia bacterium]|jgi:RNA polymerase sigma-70 factor (ECF subfamily)